MGLFSRQKPVVVRGEKRFPTFSSIDVLTQDGDLITEATLRDISVAGALVRHTNTHALPKKIRLRIPVLEQTVDATIVWSSETEFGLRFDTNVDLSSLVDRKRNRLETVALHFGRTNPST